ncbi:hypothetical protein C8R47DRAFT_1180513 [Mycena vitilis]|nr:hypothetical protein C8R47DRAFT_1180513 [Mycena vitilis]
MVSSIIRAGLLIHFALAATALVIPRVPAGTQFITGPCASDGDCASGCCAKATALCAARLVALEGAGCGGGSGASAAATSPAAAAPAAADPVAAAATPTGTQFITGACGSDADCASGCCSKASALCAARAVALEGAGCGGGSGASAAASSPAAAAPVDSVPAAADSTAAAATPTGTQFITGACGSDADCASGCCSKANSQCAARLVALQGAGCGGGSGAAAASTPAAAAAAAPPADTAAAAATPTGTQFITGVCATDGDCASGCCSKANGTCAARLVALEGAGCGGKA